MTCRGPFTLIVVNVLRIEFSHGLMAHNWLAMRHLGILRCSLVVGGYWWLIKTHFE